MISGFNGSADRRLFQIGRGSEAPRVGAASARSAHTRLLSQRPTHTALDLIRPMSAPAIFSSRIPGGSPNYRNDKFRHWYCNDSLGK
ncbi:unnamed protein product [Penicillium pancosmium]